MIKKISKEQILSALDNMVIVTLFVFVAFSMFSISVTQIACGLGGLAWLLHTHLTDTWKDQRWPLGIPFLLYMFACLIAVANAYDVSYSYESLKKLLEILIFFWVLNCVRENGLRDSLSLVLIASATLAGLFGFYQYLQFFYLNTEQSGVRESVDSLLSHAYAHRVEGTLSTYMTFSGLLMVTGILALGRIMFRRPMQPWLWASAGIITICLLFTLTRQAWFGFVVGLIFLVFFWRKKNLWLLPILLLVIYIASPLPAQERIKDMLTGEAETFRMRTSLWKGGWEIFKDYPLTGCGFRCVDLVSSQYPDPSGYIEMLRGMHNNFVQLAVDTGILGLFAWLGIWFYFFRLLYHRSRAINRDTRECWVTYGSAAAVIAFLAGGCFETNFYDSELVMVLYFIMALPFTGSQSKEYNLGKNVSVSTRP
ncbi:MAG: O-antigen ligase family protein [Nitrospinaceae bacterium]|nr:O-antigen ligase family protein [Nitrospinaceae bacterium]